MLFRKFYLKNMASADVYGADEPEAIRKEMDQMYNDFNKAIEN